MELKEPSGMSVSDIYTHTREREREREKEKSGEQRGWRRSGAEVRGSQGLEAAFPPFFRRPSIYEGRVVA